MSSGVYKQPKFWRHQQYSTLFLGGATVTKNFQETSSAWVTPQGSKRAPPQPLDLWLIRPRSRKSEVHRTLRKNKKHGRILYPFFFLFDPPSKTSNANNLPLAIFRHYSDDAWKFKSAQISISIRCFDKRTISQHFLFKHIQTNETEWLIIIFRKQIVGSSPLRHSWQLTSTNY